MVAGCSSTKITDIKGTPHVPLEDALNTIPRLTMTQHPAWRPDGIGITEEFLHWGYGTSTRGSAGGVAVGIFGVASSRSVTRDIGERLYYADISDIQLVDWKRKGKQWYIVSTVNRHGQRKRVLVSRYKEDALDYLDSFASITEGYRDGRLKAFVEEQEK